jgi:hypothetical protein
MNTQKLSPTDETDFDYGQALRLARTIRRCLPEVNIHWVEAEQAHCQCGKTARLRQPSNGNPALEAGQF